MADNKNNLEDFFKNRINDFDESNDGWDLPDENIWENAQAYFPNHPQKENWNWKLGALILLAFMLIGASSYIYFLKKDLSKKSSELAIAKTELENQNNTITNLEKEVSQIKTELKQEKNNTKNAVTSLTQAEQISTKTIFSQKKIIQKLANENQQLANELILSQQDFATKIESDFSQNQNSNSIFSKKNSTTFLENVIPIAFSKMKLENDFPIKKLDLEKKHQVIFPNPKKKKEKFEVGINYTSLIYEIPLLFDFEKLEKEDFGKKNYTFPLNLKGGNIQIAYSINSKFWITAGLRSVSGGFEKNFSDKLIYDKSGEYLDTDGKTINEFDITSQSSFGDAGSTINFEIPDGTAIDDGDFLETNWYYSQQYKFTHVPIGVNYFMGKNKFQWFVKGGLGWNKISFGEYFVEAELSYNNENLPIKGNEKSKKDETSSQFVNGFAGAGLNYQLTQNWNIRTSFSLEKNFIQKNDFLKSNAASKVFDFGLHYRF